MSGYGSGTFTLRLSSEENVTEGTSAAANILEVYWQDEWTPLISADVTTDDKFIAGETYILDLSDESLTDITVGISDALDDPSGNLTSVLTSSGTPGSEGATLTFEPTEAMTGDTVYFYAANAEGVIVGAGVQIPSSHNLHRLI